MIDLSHFYAKQFHPVYYNCGHFVFEVYLHLTGKNLEGLTDSLMQQDYHRFKDERQKLKRIDQADNPCVAVTSRKSNDLHAGIHIDGKILHLTETGVLLDEPETFAKAGELRYYK